MPAALLQPFVVVLPSLKDVARRSAAYDQVHPPCNILICR